MFPTFTCLQNSMEVFYTQAAYSEWRAKQTRVSLGFVPTMGALHVGHIELVKKCKAENSQCVVSIFVNPTQFNDPQDLQAYPRKPLEDSELLKEAGCDVLFMPGVEEIYPEGEPRLLEIDLHPLDCVMEATQRPGHFAGVITVVDRLFSIVLPHKAYFGEKDYQQLQIIRRLASHRGNDVEVIACSLVREADGLAYSSRNARLNPEQRKRAAHIPEILLAAAAAYIPGQVKQAKDYVREAFSRFSDINLEYFSVCDPVSLQEKSEGDPGEVRMCLAARIGNIRLIDNCSAPI